jgi:hypothetical protein
MNALSLMLTRRYHVGGGSLRCFGSHRIRHATATLLVNNGMPLEEVSRYLGHSSTMPTRRMRSRRRRRWVLGPRMLSLERDSWRAEARLGRHTPSLILSPAADRVDQDEFRTSDGRGNEVATSEMYIRRAELRRVFRGRPRTGPWEWAGWSHDRSGYSAGYEQPGYPLAGSHTSLGANAVPLDK